MKEQIEKLIREGAIYSVAFWFDDSAWIIHDCRWVCSFYLEDKTLRAYAYGADIEAAFYSTLSSHEAILAMHGTAKL